MNTTSEKVATLKKAKETDVFVLAVQEISKLSAEEAIAGVSALLDAADQNCFRLGGLHDFAYWTRPVSGKWTHLAWVTGGAAV